MSNSNKRRAEQLGMPYGTASNRLRKMLMFKFAQELGYDKCFSCGERIETVEELSVEHKEPWESRPDGVKKFWDLDNIAFSHLACNVPHHRRARDSYIKENAPAGMTWCGGCKKYHNSVEFSSNPRRWNGLDDRCKYWRKKEARKRRVG